MDWKKLVHCLSNILLMFYLKENKVFSRIKLFDYYDAKGINLACYRLKIKRKCYVSFTKLLVGKLTLL